MKQENITCSNQSLRICGADVNAKVIRRFGKHGSIATDGIRMIRLQHTVGNDLVDDVDKIAPLADRPRYGVVHLATAHQLNITGACMNNDSCVAKRTQYNGIGLPTLYGSIGGDALNSLLLADNTDG